MTEVQGPELVKTSPRATLPGLVKVGDPSSVISRCSSSKRQGPIEVPSSVDGVIRNQGQRATRSGRGRRPPVDDAASGNGAGGRSRPLQTRSTSAPLRVPEPSPEPRSGSRQGHRFWRCRLGNRSRSPPRRCRFLSRRSTMIARRPGIASRAAPGTRDCVEVNDVEGWPRGSHLPRGTSRTKLAALSSVDRRGDRGNGCPGAKRFRFREWARSSVCRGPASAASRRSI